MDFSSSFGALTFFAPVTPLAAGPCHLTASTSSGTPLPKPNPAELHNTSRRGVT